MHILDVLKDRGFIAQMTFEDELYEQLKEPTTFYVGFDPTADSLHIGHYIPIMAMAHMQRAGHRPIALMGGGTAMIGDPSGKTDMRKMMTVETIDDNVAHIKAQMSRFLDFSEGKAIIANNGDWLRHLNFIDFMRDIGSLFSVNKMLTADCYKARMATDNGLSFLEFTYMLMQSYDFLELFKRYGCRLQMGGNDQWSNMLGGADLIRRKERESAFACTFQLLLTHDGRKMGKTEAGALWLDPAKTSPYDFYQYWRNVDDQDVEKCLALLTFLPMDEVRRLGALKDSAINEAKRVLAYEVTRLVHGEEEAARAQEAAAALFGGGALAGSVPTTQITAEQLAQDARVTTLAFLCGLCASKGEARKLVQGGGLTVGEEKVTDVNAVLTAEQIGAEGILLRKGKKSYHRLVLKA
ncbi:MAG TPA: tyrosine--tRNA ligase [Candidatus Onthenecus intestinigallinarum]|uniref:Tyrosine--tRNA ligase n=1 Tax=Candidatus Onthenecus intestinigallinarum TaxID=2840875 RepID=A0A9D1CQT5_9FIRM|nr:tyrosine--tRNA ligase [Candidatus Onthenecus intestinigallinarum]